MKHHISEIIQDIALLHLKKILKPNICVKTLLF